METLNQKHIRLEEEITELETSIESAKTIYNLAPECFDKKYIEQAEEELKELKQELEEIEEDMVTDYPKEDEDRERTMLGDDY